MAGQGDFLEVFLYEGKAGSSPVGLMDGLYTYGRSEGEQWLEEVVKEWPHGGDTPTYSRRTIGTLLDDISGLQPLVSINRSPDQLGYIPDGMIVSRRVIEADPDFVSENEYSPPGGA